MKKTMELYPLKFKPIYKETVWGGTRLHDILHKKISSDKKVGESWELSGVRGNLSVVSNGYLKGNNIEELIEVYMGELLGDKVYEQFGHEFPLLIKFIDANDTLSVQVHPDDAVAAERHHAFGKTEMWYVLATEKNANLFVGFNKDTNLGELLDHINQNSLDKILNTENVKADDAFFVPAGCIHAIGKGILLAEIQQTSDITYRMYDWGRDATNRPLHIDLGMDVINYHASKNNKVTAQTNQNQPSQLVDCKYFTTNKLEVTQSLQRGYEDVDSFVIYVCTNGTAEIKCKNQVEKIEKGEVMLIPASLTDSIIITPQDKVELLETYIK